MSVTDGGPAFPQTAFQSQNGEMHSSETWANGGMSLRDYFAAKESLSDRLSMEEQPTLPYREALAGEKQPSSHNSDDPITYLKWEAKWIAALRYIRADAMLAESRKGKP